LVIKALKGCTILKRNRDFKTRILWSGEVYPREQKMFKVRFWCMLEKDYNVKNARYLKSLF